MLTGCVAGKLIKVEEKTTWKDLKLMGCVIVGGPTVRFGDFQNVAFRNCIFLYDGMEVEGQEWLEFMGRTRMPAAMRSPRRGASQ